jgi:hypothetical protein
VQISAIAKTAHWNGTSALSPPVWATPPEPSVSAGA